MRLESFRRLIVLDAVRDLPPSLGLAFAERGRHVLKGVPAEWRLFAVQQ